MRLRHSTTALLLAVVLAAAPAVAQDAGSSSIIGLASVSLSAGVSPGYHGTGWGAGGTYEPFVTPHLQVGGGINYSGANGPLGYEGVDLSLTGRYLFGGNSRSAPFVAAAVSTLSEQHRAAYTAGVVGLGWLHFFTPLTAVNAQFTAGRQASGGKTATSFSVGPTTFAFGRGAAMRRSPQQAGAFDWDAGAGVVFSPDRQYSIGGSFQPFLTPYLQVGLGGSVSHQAAGPTLPWARTAYSADALVRIYYPADWLVRPFIDAFGTDAGGTNGSLGIGQRTHGVSAGVRYYLTPELAIDGRLMRTLTDQMPGGPPLPRPITTFAVDLTLHQPR